MRGCSSRCLVLVAVVGLAGAAVGAEPTIEATPLAPAGKWVGYTLSQHGVHAAVLITKGSRFAVVVDGVEGPRIDKMIGLGGEPYMSSMSGQANAIPVVFSEDGAHCAYFAQMGEEYVLFLDGKEVTRGKFSNMFAHGPLTMTAGGKHLYYVEAAAEGGYHVVMDGKPGPSSHTQMRVVSSADGAHYAYVGTQADGMDTPWGVVDGRQVKYFGDELQFTAKGHLVALLKGKGQMALNIDGRNAVVGNNISQVTISPNGGEIAAMVYTASDNKTVLTINGKAVAGTEGLLVQNIYFSPDDKRYAAVCTSGAGGTFVVLDGKKGQKYDVIGGGMGAVVASASGSRAWAGGRAIGEQVGLDTASSGLPGFTGDSSKFLYVAMSGGKSFLVSDEDESDGYQGLGVTLSPDGKRVALIGTNGTPKAEVVVDGKPIPLKGRAGSPSAGGYGLSFSPDGAHSIYTGLGVVYVDGVEQPDLSCAGQYVFSPDGRHLLLVGSSVRDPSRRGLFLDGELVATGPGVVNVTRPTFTPDSAHVFWLGNRPSETSTDHENAVLYADGKPTSAHFWEITNRIPGGWEMSAEGVLVFVSQTGDDLMRYRVTASGETSLATMVAEAKAKPAK